MHRLSTCWQPFAPAYVTHYVVQQFYIRITLCLALVCGVIPSFAQSPGIGINTTGAPPHQTAILDLRESVPEEQTKGMLIPRIDLTATNASAPVPTPAPGLLVYNTASTTLIGANTQYNVTPGYYLWDETGRWVRYDALVRRPTTYTTALSNATTTAAALWFIIPGMQSVAMPLRKGDRVLLKAHGSATTSPPDAAEGMIEIAVSLDNGVTFNSLPNGSGSTAFSVDNGTQVLSGNSITRQTPFHSWGMEGYYDVPDDGIYVLAVRIRRLSGDVGLTSGGADRPNILFVETIRP